jgi:hypothetical protein
MQAKGFENKQEEQARETEETASEENSRRRKRERLNLLKGRTQRRPKQKLDTSPN